MKGDRPEVDQVARHIVDECQDRIRNALRNPGQDLAGDAEDGPVVDVQNPFPDFQDPPAGRGAAHSLQCLRPGNTRVPFHRPVKDEGVRQDCNRHAAGLFPRLLVQHLSDAVFHVGALGQVSQSRAARAHPLLQAGLAFPHHPFGQGQQFNGVRQVVHRARQPLVVPFGPARGRAVGLTLVHREPKRRPFQSPGCETVRIHHGHPRLDGQGVDPDHLAQTGLHLPSQLGRIPPELGLDRHGLAAVRHDQNVDFLGRMVAQNMGGIDEHVVLVPPGMPRNEQFAQLAVQDGFRLDGRRSGHVPSCFIGGCVSMTTVHALSRFRWVWSEAPKCPETRHVWLRMPKSRQLLQ